MGAESSSREPWPFSPRPRSLEEGPGASRLSRSHVCLAGCGFCRASGSRGVPAGTFVPVHTYLPFPLTLLPFQGAPALCGAQDPELGGVCPRRYFLVYLFHSPVWDYILAAPQTLLDAFTKHTCAQRPFPGISAAGSGGRILQVPGERRGPACFPPDAHCSPPRHCLRVSVPPICEISASLLFVKYRFL